MNIGITGAKGFIGKHLEEVFKKKKDAHLSFCALPKCNLLKKKDAERFIKGKDVIIHTAAVNRGSDLDIIAGSVVATYNLISVAEAAKKKPKIIFISSTQAETDTVYGQSKKLCETMLEDFSKKNNVPVSIFRLTNVFGEGGRPFYNSVIATFCYQVAHGQDLTVNNQTKEFNFIYVREVAALVAKEALKRGGNKFYFKRVMSKSVISIGELANLIRSFAEIKKPKLKSKFHKDLYKTYLSYKNGK